MKEISTHWSECCTTDAPTSLLFVHPSKVGFRDRIKFFFGGFRDRTGRMGLKSVFFRDRKCGWGFKSEFVKDRATGLGFKDRPAPAGLGLDLNPRSLRTLQKINTSTYTNYRLYEYRIVEQPDRRYSSKCCQKFPKAN